MPLYLNLFVSCMLRKTFTFFGLSNLIRNRAEKIVGDAHKLWPVLILELIWFSSKTHLFHWFGIFSHFDWTWGDQNQWWHSQDDNIVLIITLITSRIHTPGSCLSVFKYFKSVKSVFNFNCFCRPRLWKKTKMAAKTFFSITGKYGVD